VEISALNHVFAGILCSLSSSTFSFCGSNLSKYRAKLLENYSRLCAIRTNLLECVYIVSSCFDSFCGCNYCQWLDSILDSLIIYKIEKFQIQAKSFIRGLCHLNLKNTKCIVIHYCSKYSLFSVLWNDVKIGTY